MADKTMEQWIKSKTAKLKKYGIKEHAVEAAIRAGGVFRIWQEPDNGNFVVAGPDAYEALLRAGYKEILTDIEVYDELERQGKPVRKAMTYEEARET